ncbi:MAG: saccharopine dehydrogenase NADP-binding domain-containing protein [Rivularia sp. (in: Bacteria)]|nr:saccharopine dehydrogenase NADP-binding domain-containing protein [Rivularia sp. MS3]
MTQRVLILGGRGRIGNSVARDIAKYTQAEITVTGRKTIEKQQETSFKHLVLDLAETEKLRELISHSDVLVHCAGPFHYRDTKVLQICIEEGVNYLDVSDHRSYTSKVLTLHEQAAQKGVTAVINTGIFPGISNSMVRQCVEQFDQPEKIHLSYVVAGSGGAGVTVMRTTFLGLQNPFEAWIDGNWETVKPYTERETVAFPEPYGQSGVYWFDMPETFTLPKAFPTVKSVVTKFGSVPDFYNHLTWIAANIFPKSWIQNSGGVEFLSQVSHFMTDVTDNFSGIGVAIRSEVTGIKDGLTKSYCSTLAHQNTAVAAGYGTGSIAQLLLEGKLNKPGVYPVEEALPTDLFQETMHERNININQSWL